MILSTRSIAYTVNAIECVAHRTNAFVLFSVIILNYFLQKKKRTLIKFKLCTTWRHFRFSFKIKTYTSVLVYKKLDGNVCNTIFLHISTFRSYSISLQLVFNSSATRVCYCQRLCQLQAFSCYAPNKEKNVKTVSSFSKLQLSHGTIIEIKKNL